MDNEEFMTAEELWATEDIREETLFVPEWGRKIRIRGLTLEQMSELATKATRKGPNGQDVIDRELSVGLTCIYGMVSPQLTENDVAKLKKKSANAVTRIVQAINALGVTEEAVNGAMKSPENQLDQTLSVFAGARVENDEDQAAENHVHD